MSTTDDRASRSGRRLSRGLLAVALAALAGCGESPPNVLVICIDALRADRLGAYGAEPSPTPSLDALARDAVVFDDATSVASWTKPSVPSLLTGLYPSEHGVFDNSGEHVDTLGEGTTTLAGILARKGWRTAAFVENDQLVARLSGLDDGFSLYMDAAGTAAQVFDRFLTWSAADGKRPWFAYLHLLDAHFPYAPDDFRLPPGDAARLRLRIAHWDLRGESWWLLRQRVGEGSTRLDARGLADLDTLYQAEIAAVDAALGRALRLLQEDGVLDRTIVVVTSDHGEGFLERGRLDHGYGPYPELLRVPLVVRLPERDSAGTRSGALVQTVDIAPTILDLVGAEKPPAWHSVSLLPAIRSDSEVRSHAIAEEKHGHWSLLSILDKGYHYVRSTDTAPSERPRAVPPASAGAGARVRARGILDGARLVAGDLKYMAAGDPDLEVAGPVESLDGSTRSALVAGVSVRVGDIGDGEDDDLRFGDLSPGVFVRAHGALDAGTLVATRVERVAPGSIEVEGVVSTVRVLHDGDAEMVLGGLAILVDPRAAWRGFPGETPPTVSRRSGAPRSSEELFDRIADPAGRRDIARDKPDELVRLRALADAARAAGPGPSPAGRALLDDESRERLRALGYVE